LFVLTVEYLLRNAIFDNKDAPVERQTKMNLGQALVKKETQNFMVTKTVGLISDIHVPKRAKFPS
jgi:hypothetical protein